MRVRHLLWFAVPALALACNLSPGFDLPGRNSNDSEEAGGGDNLIGDGNVDVGVPIGNPGDPDAAGGAFPCQESGLAGAGGEAAQSNLSGCEGEP